MPALINRVVLGVIIAVIVGLVLILLGGILVDIHVEIAATVGDWLKTFAFAIGILCGLWYFFTHGGVNVG